MKYDSCSCSIGLFISQLFVVSNLEVRLVLFVTYSLFYENKHNEVTINSNYIEYTEEYYAIPSYNQNVTSQDEIHSHSPLHLPQSPSIQQLK